MKVLTREWWGDITNTLDNGKTSVIEASFEKPECWDKDPGDFHVIEYSSYEKLEREIASQNEYISILIIKWKEQRTKSAALVEALEKFALIPECPDELFERGMVVLRGFASETIAKWGNK